MLRHSIMYKLKGSYSKKYASTQRRYKNPYLMDYINDTQNCAVF